MQRRNTKQKAIIIDTLKALDCHASAGMVYEAIKDEYPTISRATVFRVLAEQAADGNLLRISFAGYEDRFDFRTNPHCHIRCRKCGYVGDIMVSDFPDLESCITDASGFTVEGHNLEYIGLCRKCAESEKTTKHQGES